MFLRLRNCTEQVEDLAADLHQFKRVWTAGEGNRIVARAVTTSLTRTTTFLIALAGYSGGGKSFAAFGPHGLLPALIERLPPLFIAVTEVLHQTQSLGSYLSTDQSAAAISTGICESRRSAATIGNMESSRTHLVVRFEDQRDSTL